jgi:hypothetical protein
MSVREISIVLPVRELDEGLDGALRGYADSLAAADVDWELVLVPMREGGAAASQQCARIAAQERRIDVAGPASGWGGAISAGLRASTRELLCFTNWQRTPAQALSEMVELALRNPQLVLRANRRTRDTRVQRLGSLLFNVECRLLLQIPVWDVNGTPKIFPRAFGELLELSRSDDLLDAEFAFVCEQSGYPVLEVPIDAERVSQRSRSLGLLAALKLYLGVPSLRAKRPR